MNLVAAVALVLAQGRDVDSFAGRVRQLADSYLAAYFERHPDEATLDGVAGGPDDRLPDDSPLALAAWQAREDAWLAELRAIDPAPFGGRPEAVAYGVMRDALEGAIATRVCRHELWNVGHTGNGAIAIITALTSLQPVGTEVARRQTLARWRAIPAYLASEEENQRTGLRLGFSAPRGNVRISLTQLDSLLGTPLERSPLLDPARRDITPAFRVELERVLTTDVLPALRGYRDFLERDYLPRARSAIGVSANPDGAACYRASIRATTGLDLSPDAVRRLGIATVAALEAEMRVIARRSFRTRDVGALLERLRTAAAFTFRSRRAMLDAARGAVLRAKAAMPAWFGRLPRADTRLVRTPSPGRHRSRSLSGISRARERGRMESAGRGRQSPRDLLPEHL